MTLRERLTEISRLPQQPPRIGRVRDMGLEELHIRLADALKEDRFGEPEKWQAVKYVSTCNKGGEPSPKQIEQARDLVRRLRQMPRDVLDMEVLVDE